MISCLCFSFTSAYCLQSVDDVWCLVSTLLWNNPHCWHCGRRPLSLMMIMFLGCLARKCLRILSLRLVLYGQLACGHGMFCVLFISSIMVLVLSITVGHAKVQYSVTCWLFCSFCIFWPFLLNDVVWWIFSSFFPCRIHTQLQFAAFVCMSNLLLRFSAGMHLLIYNVLDWLTS
jgi:hypothetical protein